MKKSVLFFFLLCFTTVSFGQKAKAHNNTIKYNIETYNIVKSLDIKGFYALNGVHIFPNPVKDNLNIDFPDQENYEIYFYDLQSKLIFKRTVNNSFDTSFNLTNLKSGTYLISIIDKTNKKATILKVKKI